MTDYFRTIVSAQYDAALSMLRQCVVACPVERWEEKVANGTVRWVAYHTLFFTELYLSRETEFTLSDLHQIGGDEREDHAAPGLDRTLTIEYADRCHELVHAVLARENESTLRGESGFRWLPTITRGELHLYNIRHIQHHAGQLSAHLRRIGVVPIGSKELRWVGSGWRV